MLQCSVKYVYSVVILLSIQLFFSGPVVSFLQFNLIQVCLAVRWVVGVVVGGW